MSSATLLAHCALPAPSARRPSLRRSRAGTVACVRRCTPRAGLVRVSAGGGGSSCAAAPPSAAAAARLALLAFASRPAPAPGAMALAGAAFSLCVPVFRSPVLPLFSHTAHRPSRLRPSLDDVIVEVSLFYYRLVDLPLVAKCQLAALVLILCALYFLLRDTAERFMLELRFAQDELKRVEPELAERPWWQGWSFGWADGFQYAKEVLAEERRRALQRREARTRRDQAYAQRVAEMQAPKPEGTV